MADVPPCPPSLRAIQHYLKVAQEHATRDPVVSYWSQFYALQTALNIDRKSDESKAFLVKMMDRLEKMKKEFKDNEAITNEIAAQAHIENYALKLFIWADSQDRASNFGKNVVKAFYTSGMLFDVLTTFGELAEEIQQNRKYAKWKAAYIHNCLKNGETPVPGPMKSENEMDDELSEGLPSKTSDSASHSLGFDLPQVPQSNDAAPSPYPSGRPFLPGPTTPEVDSSSSPIHQPTTASFTPIPIPNAAPKEGGGVTLSSEQMIKAQKYCKWAGSALNYDDIPTAIENMEKALHLLKTGIDT